jgi:hypothetical protein
MRAADDANLSAFDGAAQLFFDAHPTPARRGGKRRQAAAESADTSARSMLRCSMNLDLREGILSRTIVKGC